MRARQPGEAPGKSRTNVFLAYASEDETVANTVQDAVENYATTKKVGEICVIPWPRAPEVGKSILQNLLSKMRKSDFGIFLLTPVDENKKGDSERLIARDNVVFETGLFMGMKDAEHTFMLLPDKYQVAPSDLEGIIGIQYNYDKVNSAATRDERKSAIRPACEDIMDRIQDVMAQHQPSASQPSPDTGQAPAGAGPAQPISPLELLGAALMADAAQDNLTGLRQEDVKRGRLVVHALHGVGQVVAFDPPGPQPRYITVQFSSSSGVFDIAELFVTPRSV